MRRRDKKLLTGIASAGQFSRIGRVRGVSGFHCRVDDGALLPDSDGTVQWARGWLVDTGKSTDENND